MKKPLTVTIGIPAYNEEQNIALLIKDVLKQKQKNYVLEKILVASDGSSDNTVGIVNSLKNSQIEILDFKERLGLATRLNNLIENSNSDCLIALNADIRLKGATTIKKLIAPILKGADLAAGNIVPTEPTNLLEKVLYVGCIYKNNILREYNNGDNYLSCHGPIRAFSKKLYKNLRFKFSAGEDTYSYLYCKKNNFKYVYAEKAEAIYKLPSTLSDHLNQLHRFLNLNQNLDKEFGKNFVRQNMYIPKHLFILEGVKIFTFYPLLSVAYAGLTFVVSAANLLIKKGELSETWGMVLSSKEVK